MRLFVAIDLPEEIKKYLRVLQDRLPEEQMTNTRDFHLTLKFLGECDGDKKNKVLEILRGIHFDKFEVSLGHVGFFGDSRAPKVVWVSLKAPENLKNLAVEIEKSVAPCGFEPEKRFAPHLTLARVKFVLDGAAFATALGRIKVEPLKFPVDAFYLFESHLFSTGAVYKKLEKFAAK